MKLKRLYSLAGLLAALLLFSGANLQAADVIGVGDAQAFAGGNDTVDVMITTDTTYNAIELGISYDSDVFDYVDESLSYNQTVWNPAWGEPVVTVDSSAGTIHTLKVAFYSTNIEANIPESSASIKMISVVLAVDEDATTGTETITPSGIFTKVTPEFETEEVTVTSLTSGDFLIQSEYIMEAQDVEAGIGEVKPVNVYLTNAENAVGVEFTVAFDSTQLGFVAGSVEINESAWSTSTLTTEVDSSLTGRVKIAVYTTDPAGNLPASNDSRWIARLSLAAHDTAATGVEVLDLQEGIVTTVDSVYETTDHSANMTDGSFTIVGKHLLKVSSDAAATVGNSDTVKVYYKNAETVVGIEAELTFNGTMLNVDPDAVDFNEGIFDGGGAGVSFSVDTTSSSLKILAYGTAADSIAPSAEERLLFTMVMSADSNATPAEYPLTVSGIVTTRDENYETTDKNVSTITNGKFTVLSSYVLQVESVTAAPGVTRSVNLLFSNRDEVSGTELVVTYDTLDLTYVSESVVVNSVVYEGDVPVPTVTASHDSIRIELVDLQPPIGVIPAGGSGQKLLTLSFGLGAALVNGDSTLINVAGTVAVVDENYDVSDETVTGIGGYIKVVQDITPPGKVQNVVATPGDTTVSLSWTNPSDTDLDWVKVVRKTAGGEDMTVLLDDDPTPGADGSYVDGGGLQAGIAYQYEFTAADNNGNVSDAVLSDQVMITGGIENYIKVVSKAAIAGGQAVNIRILGKSTESDVAGVGLTLSFDNTKLEITGIAAGKDSMGLAPLVPIDVDSANANGQFSLAAVDAGGSNPIPAGTAERELLVVTVKVIAGTANGQVALALSNASMSDPMGENIELTAIDGYVNVVSRRGADIDGNGTVDARDLWYYLAHDLEVAFEDVVECVTTLLSQPVPTTLLASVQEGAYSAAGEGATLVSLDTDFEIVAARFTFSYNPLAGEAMVQLSRELEGNAYLKKITRDNKLVIDVISLGGFTPSQMAGEVFSVDFRDDQKADLALEKVEVGDRNGTVYVQAGQVSGGATLPKAFSLAQNVPNPFNPSTTIAYEVPESESGTKVVLSVYNIRGQKVITLVDELKEAGQYSVNWNGRTQSGSRVPSGVYFYRMSAGDFSAVRKMVILK